MIKKIKILYLCTDPAGGMIPFASKIINAISNNLVEYEIFGIFICKGKYSYRNILNNNIQSENLFFIESSQNPFLSFIEKLYPIRILSKIRSISKNNSIDFIHCLTTEFCLGYYL